MSGVKHGGGQGASMNAIEQTPKRRRQHREYLKRQERRWAAKAGPVEVRRIGDPPASSDDDPT